MANMVLYSGTVPLSGCSTGLPLLGVLSVFFDLRTNLLIAQVIGHIFNFMRDADGTITKARSVKSDLDV